MATADISGETACNTDVADLIGELPAITDDTEQAPVDEVDPILNFADALAEQEAAGNGKSGGKKKGEKTPAAAIDPMPAARRFISQHGMQQGELALRFSRDECFLYDGKAYRVLPEDELRSRIIGDLDKYVSHLSRALVSMIRACIAAETLVPAITEPPCWLDDGPQRRNYVAVENGLLDVDAYLAGEPNALRPHSPLWFSRVCLPYSFDPAATCQRWVQFLDRVFAADAERIALAQEWAGLSVIPDTSFQRFLMCEGPGGNGKSVFIAAIEALVGLENCSHVPLEAFGGRFQLNQTLGKLLNIAAEVGELDKLAEGFLKSFTSGDRMQFERKHKDPIEAIPTARLVLATNNPPRFSDRSDGIWRRLLMLPFHVTITAEERVLGMDKPSWWHEQGELPGMLNWALEGLRRLREQGRFTESDACKKSAEAYRRESNPAGMFLSEHYVADLSGSGDVVTSELFAEYRQWCEANGYRSLAAGMFGKEIVRAFPLAEKAKVWNREGRRTEGYRGIVRNNSDTPDTPDF
jgi:P4 family phage/plasmid primase-like protien